MIATLIKFIAYFIIFNFIFSLFKVFLRYIQAKNTINQNQSNQNSTYQSNTKANANNSKVFEADYKVID